MRNFCLASLGLLLALACVSAQDAATPKLTFKLSGESVYDFEAEASLTPVPDTSTARGVVLYWSHIASNPKAYGDKPLEPEERYKELAEKAVRELEGQVLGESLTTRLEEQRKSETDIEPSYQSAREPVVIESETKQDDGSVVIVTSQTRTSRYKDKDGSWVEDESSEQYLRYTVLKGDDGKWRISLTERGRIPRNGKEDSKEDSPEITWESVRNSSLEFAYEFGKSDEKQLVKPEFKTGTAKEAAMSFIALREFSDSVDFHFFGVIVGTLARATEHLFTKEYIEAVHKSSDERSAKNKRKEDTKPEIEEVRDEFETSAMMVFKKTDSKASDKLVIKVVKKGDTWRVNEVGDLRDAGTEKESYEPKEYIYRRW